MLSVGDKQLPLNDQRISFVRHNVRSGKQPQRRGMVAHIVRAEDETNLLSQIVFNEITQLLSVFPACQTVNQQNFIAPNQGRRVRLVSFADKHKNILFQLFFTHQGRPLFPSLLWRLANACTGLRARVVYSRLFPDWTPDRTRPQTGRLNKSPHTVYAFANRSTTACALSAMPSVCNDRWRNHQRLVRL